MTRTKSSIFNFSCAIVGQGLGLIVSFISRIIFIKYLGSEYLGLNGLFTNILSILSLTELGVGTAITYSLYKPLSEKDNNKCLMLMQFYKKVYTIIGIIILVLGFSITPFLPIFIKDIPNIKDINFIYILFVINTAISYFYSYKRNLIIADQNRYVATIYRYSMYIVTNLIQMIYLLLFKNYIGYLVIQILSTFIENILVSKKAEKMYPYLKKKNKIPLEKNIRKDIIQKTKAMMFHKVGDVVVNSTDNILLSSFVNLVSVGIYSNYSLIISAINTITSQIYSSLTASIGNLCASSSKKKQYSIYKNINFLTFWVYYFCSVCLFVLLNPFIEIWVGKEYLFDMKIVLVLVINFYLKGMRNNNLVFREATGLFEKDKWKAILEAFINLIISIILVKKIGVLGIFLGTLISSITTCVWVEPYVLYKYAFQKNPIIYFKKYMNQFIILGLSIIITYILCNPIHLNIYLNFVIKVFICLIVPNLILFCLYKNSEEFQYFYEKIFSKIIKKWKRS